MNPVSPMLSFFFRFHRGTANIALHILGFAGIILSIIYLNGLGFALSLLVVEAGHLYNHFRKIEPYDFRPKALFTRLLIFVMFVGTIYWLSNIFQKAV